MRLLVTGGSGFMGTNLVSAAIEAGVEILSLDINPPFDHAHTEVWIRGDILDGAGLASALSDFAPSDVVHFAARTDTTTDDPIYEYPENIAGTSNILRAVHATPSVERLIITSSQFVCRPGYKPAGDKDYDPHTVYGESKAITEQLTRASGLDRVWTIIRPTTIWGPWCERYRAGFFPALRRGRYLHPGSKKCFRSYGFIGNVVHQVFAILRSAPDAVSGRTLYVGDEPAPLIDWVNLFSQELVGAEVRVVPRAIVRVAAWYGDLLKRATGRSFPITSSRYRSMTEDYRVDMQSTFDLLGPPPYSIRQGVEQTINWLRRVEGATAPAEKR